MNDFAEQRVGQILDGRWTLRSVLGKGGMGVVYAATDADGCEVAIKVLHPEFGRESHTRERFLREADVANRVDHPAVVRVLHHGVASNDTAYIVMEKLEGQSLGELLASGQNLPLPDLLDVLDQVLDVLVRAHEAQIVHRDLKPDNLFLTDDEEVKLLDFGVARILDEEGGGQRTKTGVAVGTVTYMAPEQAMGRREEIDGRVDLFALGAMAFRLLAGRRVHEATTESALLVAAATQRAPKLATVAQHLPLGVCQIVDTALLFDRGARYPDAKTMQADVRAAQRGQAPPFAMGHAQSLDAPTRSDGDQVLSAFPVAAPASATFGGQAVTQSIEDSPSGFRVGPLALLLGVAFAAGLAWMLTSERGEVTPEASEPSKDSASSLAAAGVEGEEHQEQEAGEEEEERQEPVEEQRGALQENSRQVSEPAPEEQQPAPQVERQGGKRQREHAREDKKWRKERERKSKR